MIFAKIQDDICINILEFESEMAAEDFDDSLIKLKEGYGIGDIYLNGAWSKKEETKQEKIEKIKEKLLSLDNTINRATEDLYTLTNATPYEAIQNVINFKIELRKELKTLNGGDGVAEDITN